MNSSKGRKQGDQRLPFLFFFIFLTSIFLFAEYFHIEEDIGDEKNCPICRWESSLFTFGQLFFFTILLLLVLFSILALSRQGKPSFPILEHSCCRAPPRPLSST